MTCIVYVMLHMLATWDYIYIMFFSNSYDVDYTFCLLICKQYSIKNSMAGITRHDQNIFHKYYIVHILEI